MSASITVGGLLLGLGALVGFLIVGFGLLATFAAGMSTNPEASADANRTGCAALLFGGLLFGASVWGLLS